jgi:type I restriction enzyme M protein
MDDMDKESEEMGGKATFFTGEYEKYAWSRIFDPRLGGFDLINTYSEAIIKMNHNPNIPQLFRDIFKNAYLPYRDPETLKSFLKEINEFHYDHSERLGDAFEYLLSVLGSQGEAGQFRTPRHIIDFIVSVVDPKKNDTIADPACGTAGFLISSYKHILKHNTKERSGDKLTPDERKRLLNNFAGYDISPDMVRLSLVNMYLHEFPDPKIHEYDTLTSEERWNETFDVILANPPFMTPKGGIRPHKRFSIQAKRSEVLFVDYIAEHLNPNGRGGVIVPEGIIFQSQTAYKQLRKMLVKDYLWAVVSLPAGVFQPYSGVKTSILLMDKTLSKKTDKILFVKIENDGFELGATRRPIDKNDLPHALDFIKSYHQAVLNNTEVKNTDYAHVVNKSKIAESGDWNLSGERYKLQEVVNTEFSLVPIGNFKRDDVKSVDPRKTPDEYFELLSIPAYDSGSPEVILGQDIGSSKKCVYPNDILLSRIIPHIRRAWVVENPSDSRRQIASTEWIVFSSNEVIPKYLREVVVSDNFHKRFMQTITGVGGSLQRASIAAVCQIQIPLPPLSVQEVIVVEIDGYQKIIDGARQVVDNYKPTIKINPDWEMVELKNVCHKITDGTHKTPNYTNAGIPFLRVTDLTNSDSTKRFISRNEHEELIKRCKPEKGDVLYSKNGTIGVAKVINWNWEFSIFVSLALLKVKEDLLNSKYLECFLNTPLALSQAKSLSKTGTVTNLHLVEIKKIKIPLPPSSTQEEIVTQIEEEQELVNANKKLIAIYEQKIKDKISEVWGDSKK